MENQTEKKIVKDRIINDVLYYWNGEKWAVKEVKEIKPVKK
jgi:hypothetical protein